MSQEAESRRPVAKWGRLGLGALVAVLTGLAVLASLTARATASPLIGLLLVLAALVEIAHGFRRSSEAGRRAAWSSGAVSLLMGVLLINASSLAGRALVVALASWFAIDAGRYLVGAAREIRRSGRSGAFLLPALGNAAVAALLLLVRGVAGDLLVLAAGVLRIAGTAWNILAAPVHAVGHAGVTAVEDLGLPDTPELRALGERIAAEEGSRTAVDHGWIWAFVVALFAIHLGRMGMDRSATGVMSPGLAVLGDLFLALVIAYGLVIPARLAWRRATRRLERLAWRWVLLESTGSWSRRMRLAGRHLLTRRLRFAVRLRGARYSFTTAVSRGLQIGLPAAAVITATVPIFGMNWFFDTENWATGVWNSWAEARTDTWREAMVRSVFAQEQAADRRRPFLITPPGTESGADFAFLVIGDTGEGDLSQHVLRDQLLEAARHDEVKFIVVSSDVVYPTGAMRDYEAKFWLPFKGAGKPVYAIPGNHDWYDALEAFAATFMEPEAARTAMRARVDVDHRMSSTTEGRIGALIVEADRLRREYRVPTGFQRAPFFHFQTDRFALVAVDTGIVKRVDALQWAWLEAVLREARGKLVMAVLGHPLYAGGHYQAEANEDFAALHRLLREHGVAIVMAGDTHDLEYYAEPRPGPAGAGAIHHFVNGGGGAYLSLGTALAWPREPATRDFAFYPRPEQVASKVEANLQVWKRPLWWWTRRFAAWPFSAEWLSAAFDYNVAPFYQSFVEVRVEGATGRVRLRPWGVNGRLRWSDLRTSPGLRPSVVSPDDLVEWTVGNP